jgi:hypothetical protein
MIYDSVIQNDITYANHFNWWGIIKQDGNATPPNQELEQEKKLRENEGMYYKDYLDSGNINMSLLDTNQQTEFTQAESKIRQKYPKMPINNKYRKLVFDQVQSGRKQQLQQQPQQPQQPKRGLTRRALGGVGKLGYWAGKEFLGGVKRNIQDAVTMPIEGTKKLGRGIADSISRTEQGLQERADFDTKRKVQQIDAKTPEVKSKEAQQIKELASSRVFGKKLADPMQGDILNRLVMAIKDDPDKYSRGNMRTASGGYTRGDSLDDIANTFGMNDSAKSTVKRIFGNQLSPIAVKAIQLLYESKQGTPSRTVTPASERTQPNRRKSSYGVEIGG